MSLFDHLVRDARHALRTISRMPLLASVVVVSLGIGIGVNVVVFSWLQAVVLQPLPGVAHARQLVFVEPRSEAGTHPGVSWQEYEDLRDRLRTFDSLIAFRMVPFNVGEPSRNERIYGQLVSGNYFSGLGLTASAGRFFRADEVSRSANDFVMVVSHGLALSRFGSPAAAIGQSLRVNDRDVTIVGVAPEHFQGTVLGLDFSMWVPATLAPSLLAGSRELDSREVRGYAALGRLAAGATQAQAQADLENVMRELARLYPVSNGGMAGQVMSFWAAPRGPQSMITGALAALQGIMLLVLLAVCGNTANLMLARASTRQREVGVRVALGAGRARIVSVLLAENVLLALGGGLLGAALAAWGTNAIRAVPFIGSFPIRFQTHVDALGLAVATALALACGVLVGLPPALQLAGIEPQRALRNGSRTMSRNRLRSLLMAAEVALALIVLLVGGLFYRGLTETREIDTGFRRAGVLLAAYDLTGRDTSNGAARDFAGRLLTRLSAMPGIESAAIATQVPLDIHGLPLRSFRIEGHARPDGQPERALNMTVSRGYFSTLGIPLVEGVDFADFAAPGDQAQVIVNEEFVRRFAAGGTRARPPRAERRSHLPDLRGGADDALRVVRRRPDADRLLLVPRSPGVCGRDPRSHPRGRRNGHRRRPPARRPRGRRGAAALRPEDDERARREEPVPAPRAGADVRGPRAAAARARRDRHLRRRRLRRRAAHHRDRRPARARRQRRPRGRRGGGRHAADRRRRRRFRLAGRVYRADPYRAGPAAGAHGLRRRAPPAAERRLPRLVAARAARRARRPDGGAQA